MKGYLRTPPVEHPSFVPWLGSTRKLQYKFTEISFYYYLIEHSVYFHSRLSSSCTRFRLLHQPVCFTPSFHGHGSSHKPFVSLLYFLSFLERVPFLDGNSIITLHDPHSLLVTFSVLVQFRQQYINQNLI